MAKAATVSSRGASSPDATIVPLGAAFEDMLLRAVPRIAAPRG